jgi:hypothetical protein
MWPTVHVTDMSVVLFVICVQIQTCSPEQEFCYSLTEKGMEERRWPDPSPHKNACGAFIDLGRSGQTDLIQIEKFIEFVPRNIDECRAVVWGNPLVLTEDLRTLNCRCSWLPKLELLPKLSFILGCNF